MDTAGKTNNHSSNGTADRKSKFLCKENHDYNLESMNRTDFKSVIALEKHNLHINCINPYLAFLPDKLLIISAKSVASSILSTAIARKNHIEVLKRLNPALPPF